MIGCSFLFKLLCISACAVILAGTTAAEAQTAPPVPVKTQVIAPQSNQSQVAVAPQAVELPSIKVKIDQTKKDELSKKLELRREELRHDGRCKKKDKADKGVK